MDSAPVGNVISVPFQNNTNLNYGPENGTQDILNIQPVIPVSVSGEWNIITRAIVPMISMPALYPGDDRTNGIGGSYNNALIRPFLNYDFAGGIGKALHLGKLPVNTQFSACYNVVTPDNGSD